MVQVWFRYHVVFTKIGERTDIEVHPNYGLEKESYGKHYSAPQRYKLDLHNPFKKCGRTVNVWIQAAIDSKGVPHHVNVVGGEGSDVCKKQLARSMTLGSFIPAFYKGKAISSQYIEIYFSAFDTKRKR